MRRAAAHTPLALVTVTALTSWASLIAWSGFVSRSGDYLMPALLGITVTAAIGVLARRFRMHAIFVLSSQALGILLFVNAGWGSSVVPTLASIRATAQAFVDSVDILQSYAAPVPPGMENTMPVLVIGGLLCHLLVDFLALTLGRVPLAGLPLLVVYTLPVSILDKPVSWIVFVLIVTGFLMMLALAEGTSTNRWGRDFGNPENGAERGPFGPQDPMRHPVGMGLGAVALALVVPLVLPSLGLQLFGQGNGPGEGDDEVRITNPMTDLRRDLDRKQDIPLVRVKTAGIRPQYLRTSVLTSYTGETWTPGDRNLPSENSATGTMPPPIGLSPATPYSSVEWQVKVLDSLKSLWLPTPMHVEEIRAGSEWRFDSTVLDFHSADNDVNTAGLSYGLTELVPEMSGDDLAGAPAPNPAIARRFSSLPSDLPDSVLTLAEEITGGLVTDFERAQALQSFFRDDERFTYSLEPSAGNGNSALEEFLEERVGYCEQFASAMAVMARAVGIPARVAVGFYQADQLENSSWEFSSHDLHAWPELYFEDYGWVRFEPTPSSHIGSVPDYTRDDIVIDEPSSGPSSSTSSAPSSQAPNSQAPRQAPEVEQAARSDERSGIPWTTILTVLLGVLVLVLLLIGPRLLRRRRRARRWHGDLPAAEAAWAELRDICLDLRRPWPGGRSPRATGALVATWFGPAAPERSTRLPKTGPELNPDAMRALEELVRAVEELRYAPWPGTDGSELWSALDTCRLALENGVPTRTRFRAQWAPASMLRRNEVPAVVIDEEMVGDHVR